MKCPKCNKEINSNQSFCDGCGANLSHTIIETESNRHIISIIVYYGVIYLLVAIVQIGLMNLYTALSGKPVYDEFDKILPQAENFISIWTQIIIYFILIIFFNIRIIKSF